MNIVRFRRCRLCDQLRVEFIAKGDAQGGAIEGTSAGVIGPRH
jgi:hypothetical protein